MTDSCQVNDVIQQVRPRHQKTLWYSEDVTGQMLLHAPNECFARTEKTSGYHRISRQSLHRHRFEEHSKSVQYS